MALPGSRDESSLDWITTLVRGTVGTLRRLGVSGLAA
jgi:hypothetical protein